MCVLLTGPMVAPGVGGVHSIDTGRYLLREHRDSGNAARHWESIPVAGAREIIRNSEHGRAIEPRGWSDVRHVEKILVRCAS